MDCQGRFLKFRHEFGHYVGTLSDGQTKGFWLLMLATSFRGRALPFHFVTYSSKTIADEESSRNLKHLSALTAVKELLENLRAERLHFVIRLNLGSHPPELINAQQQSINLTIAPEATEIYRQLSFKGRAPINVIRVWKKGLSELLWVMTDLKAEAGLDIYTCPPTPLRFGD